MENIEYRVRPVTRYVVTRYEDQKEAGTASIRTMGEYDNQMIAQEVGYALCKSEHERLGLAPGDTRIIYPQMIPTPIEHNTESRDCWCNPEVEMQPGGNAVVIHKKR